MSLKMYVLVRKDLVPSYAAVQAGHALAQYIIENPDLVGTGIDSNWHNGTLIYLAVEDENDLINWASIMYENDIIYSEFVEPDIGDEVTAVAALDYQDRRLEELFKELSLL